MVSMTYLLVETPPLGDPGSSTIEHGIMRRRPCANGWLVDSDRRPHSPRVP
jgi:hypothetical protein